MNNIRPIDDIDFRAKAESGNPNLVVTLVGNADLNVKAELDRFMTAVHEEACSIGAKEVVVDLKELEFMNSSCLKSFVYWISTVHDLSATLQYHITFVSSPEMYWQRRSLTALAGLAAELVSISASA
jgi:anti-anti-sigma factor